MLFVLSGQFRVWSFFVNHASMMINLMLFLVCKQMLFLELSFKFILDYFIGKLILMQILMLFNQQCILMHIYFAFSVCLVSLFGKAVILWKFKGVILSQSSKSLLDNVKFLKYLWGLKDIDENFGSLFIVLP